MCVCNVQEHWMNARTQAGTRPGLSKRTYSNHQQCMTSLIESTTPFGRAWPEKRDNCEQLPGPPRRRTNNSTRPSKLHRLRYYLWTSTSFNAFECSISIRVKPWTIDFEWLVWYRSDRRGCENNSRVIFTIFKPLEALSIVFTVAWEELKYRRYAAHVTVYTNTLHELHHLQYAGSALSYIAGHRLPPSVNTAWPISEKLDIYKKCILFNIVRKTRPWVWTLTLDKCQIYKHDRLLPFPSLHLLLLYKDHVDETRSTFSIANLVISYFSINLTCNYSRSIAPNRT